MIIDFLSLIVSIALVVLLIFLDGAMEISHQKDKDSTCNQDKD